MSEPEATPYAELGGREAVSALVQAFYDVMERDEPELTAQHRLAADGRIHADVRERFALYLAKVADSMRNQASCSELALGPTSD